MADDGWRPGRAAVRTARPVVAVVAWPPVLGHQRAVAKQGNGVLPASLPRPAVPCLAKIVTVDGPRAPTQSQKKEVKKQTKKRGKSVQEKNKASQIKANKGGERDF